MKTFLKVLEQLKQTIQFCILGGKKKDLKSREQSHRRLDLGEGLKERGREKRAERIGEKRKNQDRDRRTH